MSVSNIHIGLNQLVTYSKLVNGEIVTIDNEKYYRISNYDKMSPFFMNIVSDTDLWMFISSNGALSAGRKNPDNALFPYYTDDRIHDSQDITGSKTIIFVIKNDKSFLWEPFSSKYQGIYKVENNIYKNIAGNKLVFEQVNHDLLIKFQYMWSSCDEFGFIKRSNIKNIDTNPVTISIVDGIQNILPSGTDRKFQLEYSTLLDGYKRNELLNNSRLGLFTLSSIPTDKAEPSESLLATTVWSTGMNYAKVILSSKQLNSFCNGKPVVQENLKTAERGAYFLHSEFNLLPDKDESWYIVADINNNQSEVVSLEQYINSTPKITQVIDEYVLKSTESLKNKVAKADGYQLTNDQLNSFRHFSNTLFNIMRGGIFNHNDQIDKKDFISFVQTTNFGLLEKHSNFFIELKENFTNIELIKKVELIEDPVLEKLCYEYMPITFGRRHGDPSRPWNYFSIDIKDEQGEQVLNYQGNWRDIFQNWEALAWSYPNYIENMIAKFVNASTADGYNPYRITRDGFDWEVLDPTDAWSYIGYWGDHQIIYLSKLLELSVKFHPEKLKTLLTREIYAYSNVPYKIKSYNEITKDPHNTIDFDFELNALIEKRVEQRGTDGKFIWDDNGQIYYVNLTEKLLVAALVKFSNLIPEAGIWMNTQRPEWNDANNALVGYGTSMVTMYYLRRFIVFCKELFETIETDQILFSENVFDLFAEINNVLTKNVELLSKPISNKDRKRIVNSLGQAGSNHRINIYNHGFSDTKKYINTIELVSFSSLGLEYINHSIAANKRSDDLYHAYNLINLDNKEEISIRHLYEMLEGQVAVLSSGYLSINESINLLNVLRNSKLYRDDQASYILYPKRNLAGFVEKNNIPIELYNKSDVLKKMIMEKDHRIIEVDIQGKIHFNGKIRNARILKQVLYELDSIDKTLLNKEKQLLIDIYESVFDHQSFTGRSGTFYKYEGLGSIYWHMVSKLLLSVQEIFAHAIDTNESAYILKEIKNLYYEIREGIGSHKNPDKYGAFPTDPYSHTPYNSGVQQPGMTGQVKEDIIARFGELGLVVKNGKIQFNINLIKQNEILDSSNVFYYYDVNNYKQSVSLDPGMFAFTFCQVPIIYKVSDKEKIILIKQDGSEDEINGLEIDQYQSKKIFERQNLIKSVKVLISL